MKREFKENTKLKTFLVIFCLTTLFLSFYHISTVIFARVGPKGYPPTQNVSFGDFCQKIYGGCLPVRCKHPCASVAIGGTCAGGKVAYHNGNGGGFIVHPTDSNGGNWLQWGCEGPMVENTSREVGTGLANTNAVIAFHDSIAYYGCTGGSGGTCVAKGCSVNNNGTVAAKICKDLSSGGYTDWYLPSHFELVQLYAHRVAIGGFNADRSYWSSSDTHGTSSGAVGFLAGSITYNGKAAVANVRCVRAF